MTGSKIELKDLLRSINKEKIYLLESENDDIIGVSSWVLNHCFISYAEVLLANQLNISKHITVRNMYDFYFYALPLKNRYNPWVKPEKSEYVQYISEYYNCAYDKAIDYVKLMSYEQLEEIKQYLSKKITK